MFRLLAANCHRAGNLMNSTCAEFLGAKVDKKKKTYVMFIVNHKTSGECYYVKVNFK